MQSFLKCKMCGGDLRIISGLNIAECEYCGTRQSVPRTPDERKTSYFNRANEARRANEFDKAIGIYESIVAEYPDEAEAYWGLCLCKFGIEYVDDPKTGRKIPTCHRTAYDSIFEDKDYNSAISHGDMDQVRIFKQEAVSIDKIQKSILNSVNLENPYDVFICYKETDERTGQRTKESVIGQEIFENLCSRDIRTFFARVSLEDVLGEEYEPHIFAALNSARVMLVLGSSNRNFNAPWVRNEWSRYLEIVRKDKNYSLIPCFINMDPYDLPNEFSSLQAQNLEKVGAIQDLIRGIEKILGKRVYVKKDTKTTSTESKAGVLFERGKIAVRNKEWSKARRFFDEVLNINPRDAEVYTYLLLVEKKCRSLEELSKGIDPIDKCSNFKNAVEYADEELKNTLYRLSSSIIKRKRVRRKKITLILSISALFILIIVGALTYYIRNIKPYRDCYSRAVILMNNKEYEEAIDIFHSIENYKDSMTKISECSDSLYKNATSDAENKEYKSAIAIMDYLLTNNEIDVNEEFTTLYNDCYYEYYRDIYVNNNTDEVVLTILEGLGGMQLPRDSKCESLYSTAASQCGRIMRKESNVIPKLEAVIDDGMIKISIENLSDYTIKMGTFSYTVIKLSGGTGSILLKKTFFIKNLEAHSTKYIQTNESVPADSKTLKIMLRDYDITYDVGGTEIPVD